MGIFTGKSKKSVKNVTFLKNHVAVSNFGEIQSQVNPENSTWLHYKCKAVLKKFQGAQKAKSQEVRSPTCEVLGAASKHLGTKSIF